MVASSEGSPAPPRHAMKRGLIVLLAMVNAVLVMALLAACGLLPAAIAQPPARVGGGNYLCVTAKAPGQSYDVVYLLDQASRQLHALYPPQGSGRQLTRAPSRDLQADFGG